MELGALSEPHEPRSRAADPGEIPMQRIEDVPEWIVALWIGTVVPAIAILAVYCLWLARQ